MARLTRFVIHLLHMKFLDWNLVIEMYIKNAWESSTLITKYLRHSKIGSMHAQILSPSKNYHYLKKSHQQH